MVDIFISYKHEDRDRARAIAEMFVRHGYDVWWDIDLLPGQKFADEINAVINQAKVVVVLWTAEAIQSDWVKSEAYIAMERGTLVPVWLEMVDLPVPYNTLHTLDITAWQGDPSDPVLDRLLAGVVNFLGKPSKSRKVSGNGGLGKQLEKYNAEVEFWSAITASKPQLAEEYRAYLRKFGENGNFTELAKIRLKMLLDDPEQPGFSKKKLMYLAGSLLVLILFFFILSQDWRGADKGSQANLGKYLGTWVAHPMEIYTEVSPVWQELEKSAPKKYFNPQVTDASIKIKQGERGDELIATIDLLNESFDHRFNALVQVSAGDLWMTNIKHVKQYGAEPNLKIKSGVIDYVQSGKLGVELEITEYANISFFAERQ